MDMGVIYFVYGPALNHATENPVPLIRFEGWALTGLPVPSDTIVSS
jgi:hypothetical protein